MTGIYLRVNRDGRWQNVEIDQLTDEELDAVEHRAITDPDDRAGRGWTWAKALAKWIRDNVREEAPGDGPMPGSPDGRSRLRKRGKAR